MKRKLLLPIVAGLLLGLIGMACPQQAKADHEWGEHGWRGGWYGNPGRHLGWYHHGWYGNPGYYAPAYPYSYYDGTWMDRLFNGGSYYAPRYYRYSRSWY